jgi:hypothetical protein
VKLAGYTYLIEELELSLPPLDVELALGNRAKDEVRPYGSGKIKILAKTKVVGSGVYENLETAIQYQGIRLAYLVPIFEELDPMLLTCFIRERFSSVSRRCIWYLYEWLTDEVLQLDDSKSNYAPLLDEQYYYTAAIGVKNSRTRIINNMIGNKSFSPMIRKIPEVIECAEKDFMEIALSTLSNIHESVNPELLGRSVDYLYTKETKSSTEIEKESTAEEKMSKFYRVLKTSGAISLSKRRLIDIQNEIVRGDKKDTDFRKEEIYVGETRLGRNGGIEENIHFIGPKHDCVESMMKGLLDMHKALLLDNTLPPMMHAALVSFGFVYIHPFSDGNGRIHRYLIHDVLKSRTTMDQDFIIPVSAAILQRSNEYDRVLESISKPVMALIKYDVDDSDHSISINNDISYMYRYPDLTPHILFLYEMMSTAISEDLIEEVHYIVKYDAVKKTIEEKHDLPNKELNLLTKLLIQNDGKVGKRKRAHFSDWISEQNLTLLESEVIQLLEKLSFDEEKSLISH